MGESARDAEPAIKDNLLEEQLEREEKRATAARLHTVYELKTEQAADISEVASGLRNAFIVTLVISIGIMITTSTGSLTLGLYIRPPINEGIFHFIFASVAVLYGGSFFYIAAWQATRNRTANAAILISIAVLTAYIYSIATTFFTSGESFYSMATLLLSIVLLGYWIETIIWGRLNSSLQALLSSKPQMVNLMTDKSPTVVSVSQIKMGDILLVRPGERVPVDGIITEGDGLVDESVINGDTGHRSKVVGDMVIGGSVNHEGTFQLRATRVGPYTTLAQLGRLIEGNRRSSSPLQDRIESISPFLALLAISLGAISFVMWYLVLDRGLSLAFIAAIAVVIAAGLDALTLSVPFAVAVGTAIGARQGILIKDASAIEKAAHIDTVIFDKVSCLTLGDPQVLDIIHVGKLTEPGFLRLAASIEKTSESVNAQAILKAAEKQVGKGVPKPEKFERIPGKGVRGELETRTIIVGNEQLMAESGIDVSLIEEKADKLARQGKTVVFVAVDKRLEGVLGIADEIRPGAQEMVKKLRASKIEVAMMSDDDYRTATALAEELDIDKVYADVLPEDRASKIREIQSQGMHVAVVGNGFTDADALEQADISFAVTDGMNLDVKAGSIVLARSNPFAVINAITLSKLMAGKVKQNMVWAVGYNLLAIPIAAGVLYPLTQVLFRPELAALAMSASTLMVMGNSLLLRRRVLR